MNPQRERSRTVRLATAVWMVAFAGCSSGAVSVDPSPLVLRGATVIDGTGGAQLSDRTIVIEGGRIASMEATADASVPDGARILDVEGRWVMPGIVDTHVHMPPPADQERFLRTLLAFGITTARSTAAAPSGGTELRARLRSGEALGPRFLTAGRLIDGPRTVFDGFAVVVTTEAEIVAEVRRQAAQGVDFIKLYVGISPALARAAIDEAHAHGIPVIGHLGETTWPQAVEAGIDAITHSCFWGMAHSLAPRADSAKFADLWVPGTGMDPALIDEWAAAFDPADPRFVEFADAAAESGVAMDPNLVLCEAVVNGDDPAARARLQTELDVRPAPLPHPYSTGWTTEEYRAGQRMLGRVLEAVGALHDRGVLITLGTDTMNPWMTPGVAAHRELELLVSAGLTPIEAIAVASRNGARGLGILDDVGTLEVGKSADLLVLTADPTAAIANTRAIERVVSRGRVFDPDELLEGW